MAYFLFVKEVLSVSAKLMPSELSVLHLLPVLLLKAIKGYGAVISLRDFSSLRISASSALRLRCTLRYVDKSFAPTLLS